VKVLYGVTDEQLENALNVHNATGGKLGKVLVDLEIVTSGQLAACMAVLSKNESTLFIQAFADILRQRWLNPRIQLFIESALYTSTALIIMLLAGVEESGLFSLFFAAAALSHNFSAINSDSEIGSAAIDFLVVFTGVFMAYLIAGSLVPATYFDSAFGYALTDAGIGDTVLFWVRDDFHFGGIFLQNIQVAGFLFMLAFIFRAFAVLLSICWSAFVWGVVLATLLTTTNTVEQSLGFFETILMGVVGFGPHLSLEALAYVLTGLCAIHFSKTIVWYGVFARRFWTNSKAPLLGLVAAALMLYVSANLEIYWLGTFRSWLG